MSSPDSAASGWRRMPMAYASAGAADRWLTSAHRMPTMSGRLAASTAELTWRGLPVANSSQMPIPTAMPAGIKTSARCLSWMQATRSHDRMCWSSCMATELEFACHGNAATQALKPTVSVQPAAPAGAAWTRYRWQMTDARCAQGTPSAPRVSATAGAHGPETAQVSAADQGTAFKAPLGIPPSGGGTVSTSTRLPGAKSLAAGTRCAVRGLRTSHAT